MNKKNKKICILISNPFLHNSRAYREARALVNDGYEVVVICPKCDLDLPDIEVKDGIKVKRVLKWWLPFFPKSKFEYMEGRNYLRAAVFEKADIYDSYDFDTLIYGYLASKRNQAKLIYSSLEYWKALKLHGLTKFQNIYYSFWIWLLEPFFARKADLVVTVNDELTEILKHDFRLKKPIISLLSVPVSRQQKTTKNLIIDANAKDKFLGVYVGNLSEGRGVENILSAAKLVDDNFKFAIIGYGPAREDIANRIKIEKLEKKVALIDAVESSELISYISKAQVGIIPTLGINLSFVNSMPNKLFEYVHAGCPICASDLPVQTKFINKYKIGLTYNWDSPEDLAEKMKQLYLEPEKMKEYRENQKVLAKVYNWESEQKKLLNAIEDLV